MTVAQWAERIVTTNDAILVAAWIDEQTDRAGLAEFDEGMLVLEARADDPEPFIVVRAAVAERLEALERRR